MQVHLLEIVFKKNALQDESFIKSEYIRLNIFNINWNKIRELSNTILNNKPKYLLPNHI